MVHTAIEAPSVLVKQKIFLRNNAGDKICGQKRPNKQFFNKFSSRDFVNTNNHPILRRVYGKLGLHVYTKPEWMEQVKFYYDNPHLSKPGFMTKLDMERDIMPYTFAENVEGQWFFRSLAIIRPDKLNPFELMDISSEFSLDTPIEPQMFDNMFPDKKEREGWADLLNRLVGTLDETNLHANHIVTTASVATIQVKEMKDLFKSLVDDLKEPEMKEKFVKILESVEKTADSFQTTSEKIEAMFKKKKLDQRETGIPFLDEMIKDVGDYSIILYFATVLMHIKYNTMSTFISMIAVAIVLYLQGRHRAWIITQIGIMAMLLPKTKFFGESMHSVATRWRTMDFSNDAYGYNGTQNEVIEPQMTGDDLKNSFGLFTTMFLSFFSKGDSLGDKTTYFFSKFKTINGGVTEFGEFVKSMLEWVVTRVIRLIENDPNYPSVRFLKTFSNEYEEYSKKVRELAKSYNNKSLLPTHSSMIEIESLRMTGIKLAQSLPKDNFATQVKKFLNEDLSLVKKIQTEFERANLSLTGFRQEPASLFFFGGPGVGKSKAINDASYAAIARHIPEGEVNDFIKNPASRIYNRASELVYWDGYNAKCMVTTFDDFGQARDVPGQPDNEFMNFIRAVNVFEYNLHMASLETKGTTTFQSTYVVCSTNLAVLKSNSIISEEALYRRMDCKYIVVPKDEYCTPETRALGFMNRKLDPTKLPKVDVMLPTGEKATVTDFKPEHQDFYPCDNQGMACGSVQSFEQVLNTWFKVHDEKQKRYLQNVKSFHETFDKYREKYKLNEMATFDVEIEKIEPESYNERKTTMPLSGINVSFSTIYEERFWTMPVYQQFRILRAMGIKYNILTESDSHSSFDQVLEKVMSEIPDFYRSFFNFHDSYIEEVTREVIEKGIDDKTIDFYTWGAYASLNNIDKECVLEHCVNINTKFYQPTVEFGIHEIDDAAKYLEITRDELINILDKEATYRMHQYGTVRATALSIKRQMDVWMYSRFPLLRKIRKYISPTGLLAIPPIVGSVVLIIKSIIKAFAPNAPIDTTNESMNHSDRMHSKERSAGLKKMYGTKNMKTQQPIVKPQMGNDVNGLNVAKSICSSCQWTLSIIQSDGKTVPQGHALYLENGALLMPYHFIGQIVFNTLNDEKCKDEIIRFSRTTRKNNKIFVDYTFADVVAGHTPGSLLDRDLVIVILPDFPVCKSSVEYIVSKDNLPEYTSNITAALVAPDGVSHFLARYSDKAITVKNEEWELDWQVREYYTYVAQTSKGDCGSVFVRMNSKEPKEKIYGMHTAGSPSTGRGFSSAFFREEIINEIEFARKDLGYDDIEMEGRLFKKFKHLDVIRKLTPLETPTYCDKTEICKSPLFNVTIKSTTAPAKLKPFVNKQNQLVNPVDVAYAKYDIKHSEFTPHQKMILNDVADQYFGYHTNESVFFEAERIYTIEEALYGSKTTTGLLGINPSTSPGWPMNLSKEKNVKKKLFPRRDGDKEYDENFKNFCTIIENDICLLKKGIRLDYFYVDTLKDERRSHSKVDEGKTRLFSACPFNLLVICRMYFGHFDVHYKKNRINNWSAIGLNPYSEEWNLVARHLGAFDKDDKATVGAGDYSGFDCTHNSMIHDIIVSKINQYYYPNALEEDNQLRRNLFKEISRSRHVVGDEVVQWKGSMPSGNPLTTLINCVYNAIAFGYCYYRVVDEYDIGLSTDDFCQNVRLILMGDDNVFSVCKELRPYLNELTIPKYMREIDLVYTTELKGEATNAWRDITEVSFLKRTWQYDKFLCRYVAPMDLQTLLQICYWTKAKTDAMSIAADNVLETLNELSLHNKEVWDEYAPRIIREAQIQYPQHVFSSPLLLPWHKRRQMALQLESFY